MGYHCAIYGCPSCKRDKNRSFYRFPKDKIRCKQWVKASCRVDLIDKSEENLYKSHIICDLHFEESSRIGTRLKCNAIPTLMLPREDDFVSTKSTQTINLKVNKVMNKAVQTCDIISSDTSKTKAVLSSGTRKKKLLQEYSSEYKKRKISENERDKVVTVSELKDYMTPQLKSIIDLQKKLYPHIRGNIYDKEFKLFAFYLFLAGPSAYRVVGKIIRLPSKRKLCKININIGTQISPKVVKCLKTKIKYSKESEKYCVICVDKMSLKRHLFYQINSDKLIGLHEINGTQIAEPATQAFVVMARGVLDNWKQPLAYSFLSRSKYYKELNTWLDDVISEMFRIGYKVVAFVSDQGSNFLNIANIRNVTIKNPYFFINGHKIYYIFDVPHLLKSLRNNLLKYDFEYQDDNGSKAVATWGDIKTFYDQDNKREYRLAPKLTESHINPNKFEKKKVKYATQVFSRTVVAGMYCSIELKQLNRKSMGTVNLIELINNTFDIISSSVVSDANKYKKSFAGLPYQIETLKKFIKFLNDVTILNTNKKDVTNSVKCIKGFQISLTSIMNLREDLNSEGYKFVFTRRLNKEVLENFFVSIRQQASNCRKPTPIQFSRVFRKLFMVNMLKYSRYANSDEDVDNWLVNIDEMVTAQSEHIVENDQTLQRINDALIAVYRTDYRFDVPEQNAFHYVCGYLLRTCHDIHKCENINAYVKYLENDKGDNLPDTFVDFVKELDRCIVNVFNGERFLGCLGKEMLEAQRDIAFNDCCSCFPTDYLKKVFIRFRIYNVIRFNNRLLKFKSYRYKHISVFDL